MAESFITIPGTDAPTWCTIKIIHLEFSMRKLTKIFLGIIFGLLIIGATGLVIAHAGGSSNPISWRTSSVSLSADNFWLDINDQIYLFDQATNVITSDPGNGTRTTLELTWQEHGVEMRLFFYLDKIDGAWEVSQVRTYNGKVPGNWIYYSGFGRGNPMVYSTLELLWLPQNDPAYNTPGTVHFDGLRLEVLSDATPTPTPSNTPTPTVTVEAGTQFFSLKTNWGGRFNPTVELMAVPDQTVLFREHYERIHSQEVITTVTRGTKLYYDVEESISRTVGIDVVEAQLDFQVSTFWFPAGCPTTVPDLILVHQDGQTFTHVVNPSQDTYLVESYVGEGYKATPLGPFGFTTVSGTVASLFVSHEGNSCEAIGWDFSKRPWKANPAPTATPTATATATPSPTASSTPTPTSTPTTTPTHTSTNTATATQTNTATATQTNTAVPTSTPSYTPSATSTATSSPTATATSSATSTSTWQVCRPPDLYSFCVTATPSNTSSPTNTPTQTPTVLPTCSPPNIVSMCVQSSVTPTPTSTPTSTPTTGTRVFIPVSGRSATR